MNSIKALVIPYPRWRPSATARLLLVLLAVACLLALTAAVASGHALLERSEPEDGAVLEGSPEEVVAWFSQELDSRLSSMRVFDEQGTQVDNGDGGVDLNDLDHKSMVASLPASLPAGTYTVRWIVVSAEDDDATEGEFAFAVGRGTAAAAPVTASVPGEGGSPMWLVGALVAGLVLAAVAAFLLLRRRKPAPQEA